MINNYCAIIKNEKINVDFKVMFSTVDSKNGTCNYDVFINGTSYPVPIENVKSPLPLYQNIIDVLNKLECKNKFSNSVKISFIKEILRQANTISSKMNNTNWIYNYIPEDNKDNENITFICFCEFLSLVERERSKYDDAKLKCK